MTLLEQISTRKILPVIVDYPNGMDVIFDSNNSYIYEYELQIKGANYLSNQSLYFQVRWDGTWSDAPEQIIKDLKVVEVSPQF